MNMDEIKVLSTELQNNILNLVRAYEEKSEVVVKSIEIVRVETLGGCSLLVETPVKVDLF